MRKTTKLGVLMAALLIGGAGCKKDEKKDDGAKKGTEGEKKGTAKGTEEATGKDPGTGAATGTAEPTQGGPKTGEELAAWYEQCWGYYNDKKWDEFKGCYADDVTAEHIDSGMPKAEGPDAAVAQAKAFADAFPDIKGQPQLILVKDKDVLGVWLVTGTHTAPFKTPMGELAPTNKEVGLFMAHHVEVNDEGKVKEEHVLFDGNTFFGQLGLMPEGAPKTRPVVKTGMDKLVVVSKGDDAEKKNEEAYKAWMDAFNAHDQAKVTEAWADDFMSVRFTNEEDQDKAKATEDLAEFWKQVPDVKINLVSTSAHGDFVAGLGQLVGTVNGKKVETIVLHIVQMKDGKVSKEWLFQNGTKIAVDLGLMDPAKLFGGAGGGGDAPKPDDGSGGGGTAGGDDFESTGSPECDELVKLTMCMSKSVPEAHQAAKDTAKMYKDAISGPGKDATIEACKQSLDGVRDAAKQMGC